MEPSIVAPDGATRFWPVLDRAVGARNHRVTTRTVAVVSLVACLVPTVGMAVPLEPSPPSTGVAAVMSSFLLCAVLAVVMLRAPRSVGSATALALLLAAPFLIVGVSWVAGEVYATGQVYLMLPVLLAALCFRWGAAALVTLSVGVADALLLLASYETAYAVTVWLQIAVVAVTICVVVVRGRDAEERLADRLRELADVDNLTGLATRRVLTSALRAAVDDDRDETPTSLLLVDVDHFKEINDTHGHRVGDTALAHVASLVRRCARRPDTVARLGGDELAVLLPDCPHPQALARADLIVQRVEESPLVLPGGGTVALSVSVGVATSPDHTGGATDLYSLADAALYEAKRAGRGRVADAPASHGLAS